MSFTLRLATCVFAVLAMSVLAAWAWDAGDPAGAANVPAAAKDVDAPAGR